MGQFSNSFRKHFSYLCEYAFRFDLSCSFCDILSSFTVYTAALHALILIIFSLHTSGLGYPGLTVFSANKSFSSSKTSSRKPYTSSKQQKIQKHSAETTINFSGSKRQSVSAHRQQPHAVHPVR